MTPLESVHPRPSRAFASAVLALCLTTAARAEDKDVEDTIRVMIGPDTKKYEERLAARDKLAAMGKPAVPALEKLLSSNNETKLIWGMRTLVTMDEERPRLLPRFLANFRHADDFVREDAVRLCAKFAGDDEQVRRAVLQAVGDTAAGVRLHAYLALDEWANEKPAWEPALPCFRRSLQDPSPYVRMNMVRQFRMDPDKPDADALRMARQDPDDQVRSQAIQKLGECQASKVADVLAATLYDRDELPRVQTLHALRSVFKLHADAEGAKIILPAILRKLDDKEAYIRHFALLVISDMGPLASKGAARVRACLDDPDTSVRKYAADVLKAIEGK